MRRLVHEVRRARWTRLVRRAERARHNDFDYACTYWWGDRRPDPDDLPNRDFTGRSTVVMDRRCVVCRPFTAAEADALIGHLPIPLHLETR